MPEEILVNPEQLNLATGIERILTVGGQVTRRGLGEGFKAEWFPYYAGIEINEAGRYIVNNANAQQLITSQYLTIPRGQGFTLKAHGEIMNSGAMVGWGVSDQLGRAWQAYMYDNGAGNRYDIFLQGTNPIFGQVGADYDGFSFVCDGNSITVYRIHSNVNTYIATAYLPADVEYLQYRFYLKNTLSRIISIDGIVNTVTIPLTTSNLGFSVTEADTTEKRIIDATKYGIKANSLANRLITLSYEGLPNKNVPVVVSPLYLQAIGYENNGYVLEGVIVDFDTNGGDAGEFNASGGVIISNLRWQAPLGSGVVDFTYNVGSFTANFRLNVVPKLEVAGVKNGYYPNLAQGDEIQFSASVAGATYFCPSLPNFVAADGKVVVPYNAEDEFFGSKDVEVIVSGGGQEYKFRVYVEPIFPTPMFCGASPEKWLLKVPDFLPNSLTYDGGSMEVKNRNRFGIFRWEVNYRNLKIEPQCLCPDETGFFRCAEKLQTSKRLDAFYLFVTETKKFTVIDYHTRQKFTGVRLTEYDNDHVIYPTEQVRRLKMYYDGKPIIPILPYDIPLPDGSQGLEYFWYQIEW